MKQQSNEDGEVYKDSTPSKSVSKVLSIQDFILRIIGAFGTLGSAIVLGTTSETLPFVTTSVRFKAVFKDLPTFTFCVIANSVVCGYLAVSLFLSFFNIVKTSATKSRVVLIIFDTLMIALLTAGASASAAITYIARNGNSSANWPTFCQQYNNFCVRIAGSLIASFISVIALILAVIITSLVVSQHN